MSREEGIMRRGPRSSAGFTLVELSIVLLVIGLIIGAVAVGRDLHRNAVFQRLATVFVQGWALAYTDYADRTGMVPADNPAAPTLEVNQGAGELCGAALLNTMAAAGIAVPSGRGEGSNDHYAYLDSNGNPQDAQVCFDSVQWSVTGSSFSAYTVKKRNVMVLKRLTPDLARLLDSQIDGNPDARFGRFREASQAASTDTAGRDWSLDNRVPYGAPLPVPLNRDEDQVAVVTAYYLMEP